LKPKKKMTASKLANKPLPSLHFRKQPQRTTEFN
jgi:hypothetical protein